MGLFNDGGHKCIDDNSLKRRSEPEDETYFHERGEP
ncbi:hypothetical protein Fuma_00228 [Fuerstiella marisgermanici]|uniref:Uncharacterized protein n=1 Tax=Fuerstiella marisgermanici TaxID=1891926 RepID=A0A1P8W9A3_9PLAN|nr:hypothetical protein Fuma_00228 [Fuerstiella marisgermanici]